MNIYTITKTVNMPVDGRHVTMGPGTKIELDPTYVRQIDDPYMAICQLMVKPIVDIRDAHSIEDLTQKSEQIWRCYDRMQDIAKIPFDYRMPSDYTSAYMDGIFRNKIDHAKAAPVTPKTACVIVHGVLTALISMPELDSDQRKRAISYCVRCLELIPGLKWGERNAGSGI